MLTSNSQHSVRHMDTVLEDAGIPDKAGVALESNIPQTGTRGDGQRTAKNPLAQTLSFSS